MKKRLLGLILAITCLLLPVLTSCSDGEDYVASAKLKPMTITLYGITGESTTEEAILEVQDALNIYTEGNLSIRVLLRLFTEDEYYAKLDEAIAAAQAYDEEQDDMDEDSITTEKTDDKENNKTDRFEVVFEEEKGTQVDIFMVRGADKLQEYVGRDIAASLKVEENSSILAKYISSRYFALASDGPIAEGGNVTSKAKLYGIPCNYVEGEYTYLLVNKEIANTYGYSANDLNTLDMLSYYLEDAASDFSDYITLYNAPEINVHTFGGSSLLGAVIPKDSNAFSSVQLGSLLENPEYVYFHKYLHKFQSNNYITEGDPHALPEGEKVAAAFIKGNAALPEMYEDEYIVIPYAKPVVDDVGTVFCVSTLAADKARCLEVISAIMTKPSYRNTLQYGVENKHYKINDYTHELEIISDDYSMNYADTGNMFILEPNTSMSKEMLALAENDWALAKQQYRDAIVNPLTASLMHFNLTYYDEDNYVSGGWYGLAYSQKVDDLLAVEMEKDEYKTALAAAIEAEKATAEETGKKFDEAKFTEKFAKNFRKEFSVLYDAVYDDEVPEVVESLLEEEGSEYKAAFDAALAEAKANDANLDEAAFIEEYKNNLVNEIKKNYTFEYELGYTADLLKAVTELDEDYYNQMLAYDPASGSSFEVYTAILSHKYAKNEAVKTLIDPENGDSLVAQYMAWASSRGIA